MHPALRRLSAYSYAANLALASIDIHETVTALRPFKQYPRALLCDMTNESLIERAVFCFQNGPSDFNTMAAQKRDASARHQGVWVLHPIHHMPNAVVYNELRTGRCFAIMTAWFQVDIQSGVGQNIEIGYGPNGFYFCVWSAIATVISFAYDVAIVNNHSPHQRVEPRGAQSFLSQFDASLHIEIMMHVTKIHEIGSL